MSEWDPIFQQEIWNSSPDNPRQQFDLCDLQSKEIIT
jgi:hypothetical protein